MNHEVNIMNIEGKKIVFFGDSITAGSGATSEDNCYVSLIGKHGCCEAVNCGIGGTRFARQFVLSNEKYDRDFCGRVDSLPADADIVVVFGGTNDFGHGDAPLGTPSDRTPDSFHGACHYLMRHLHERFCGKPILFITPLHRLKEDSLRGDGSKKADAAPLSVYVDIIRKTAEYYSLPVLDLYAESGLQPNVDIVRERLMPDGLHPSDAGHAILAEKIMAKLRSM